MQPFYHKNVALSKFKIVFAFLRETSYSVQSFHHNKKIWHHKKVNKFVHFYSAQIRFPNPRIST